MTRIKLFYSIRWRFLMIHIASTLSTALVLLLGNLLATYLMQYHPLNTPIIWVINNVGSTPTMVVAGALLYLTFYLALSRPLVQYTQDIAASLQHMANGKFHEPVKVQTPSELGAIAAHVNRMSEELNEYLREIHHGLQEIAKGHFHYDIPVKPDNDLGKIAESINKMSTQLHHSIQEERNAEKTKNDLITGVSHDLRTPLTSILGFLELIEKDRYVDEVELRYYVGIAYEKSVTLKKLIDDLFEYTRINNGMPLELRKLDMNDFFQQLAEEFVPHLESAGMSCRVHAPEHPVFIKADGDRLVRAYENLIANAIRYGSDGKRVDIYIHEEEQQIVIQIVNYGSPIPERDLPFIFDRFYRADKSRSKQTGGGTGLGLAITKSIIEVHGGKIAASSSERQTCFETVFPKST
ncbi:sensor histidine kinase [Paenibacillus aquistagni]|uniref:sensor histidine kinase n=1 Tax=Paenibacillus aquistagni TaxID=1852522 RepID=UPI00145AF03D|nr:HAMP domain-containing sensor histidine kinase [Paenibacillus aquistagni]NMM54607.1 HAMP domain-containing histidine kinase [Paenibacillus aquistagni]